MEGPPDEAVERLADTLRCLRGYADTTNGEEMVRLVEQVNG